MSHVVTAGSQNKQILSIFKLLLRELNRIGKTQYPSQHLVWKKSAVYPYVIDKILSSSENELHSLEYYVDLLKAVRGSQELQAKYKGVGERSIEETARLVGLKLPKLYEDPKD